MKRKSEDVKNETYSVIETVEECNTYVDFVPYLWLVPLKKSDKIKPKDSAKFYYPCRLANQSLDKYLKLTKQAKFACAPPEKNEKWELRNCRVLKMGLVSIEQAIQSQKFYSDYFSTTEAEAAQVAVVQRTAKSKTKKLKTRAPPKCLESSSDSEGETSAVKQTSTDFNNCFESSSQNRFNLNDASHEAVPQTNFQSFNILSLGDFQTLDGQGLFDGDNVQNKDCDGDDGLILDDLSNYILPNNDVMTIDLSDMPQTVSLENQNQETGPACCVNSSCKCYKKLLNKIDYLQKKVLNEFSSIRKDMKSNQEFLKKLFESKKIQGEEIVHEDQEESLEEQLTEDEVSKCNQIYKEFPLSTGDDLIEKNDAIANDGKLRKFLFSKYEKLHVKDADAHKVVRKIIKTMCSANCISEFTWLGTNKGKSKKNFSILKSIVDLIVDVTEKRFVCDGMAILKSVIQQRTKSASEAVDKLNKLNLASSGKPQGTPETSQDPVITTQIAAKPSATEIDPVRMPTSNDLSGTTE